MAADGEGRGRFMAQMISVEEARDLILANVQRLGDEVIDVVDAAGRVAAQDQASDIDVSPFAHSAMDGFALRASQIAGAAVESPVVLRVIAEEAAGEVFEGPIADDECVRIMTGAPLPDAADSVVKYEIVGVVEGDGKPGSLVSFAEPTKLGSNVRAAGEEARAGEVIVRDGEVVNAAGVGFLAGCGITELPVYRRPRIAVISIGSELVPPTQVPTPGKIRNSNSYALAAAARQAGAVPTILPIVADSQEALAEEILLAVHDYDFVLTSGGASNGDFDFIKPVVEQLGELLMTTVNMRPGKAQTFGLVKGVPVFGLPGNPAAAYVGFQMLVRPALRKMQGYSRFEHPTVRARLMKGTKKNDPRRIFMRGMLQKGADGTYEATPAGNQSSGLFGPIQRSNCMIVLPEGTEGRSEGSMVDCLLLDVSEEVVL